MGFRLPSALARIGDPLIADLPRPLRSTFRVWLPSWRFPPSEPGSALFRADSAHGIRPSELCSAQKVPEALPQPTNPLAVSTDATHLRLTPQAVTRSATSGLWPLRASRIAEASFDNHRRSVAPLGFSLPGYSGENLGRGFPRLPLSRLRAATCETADTPQSFDRSSLGSIHSSAEADAGRGNPHRVSAPGRSRTFA